MTPEEARQAEHIFRQLTQTACESVIIQAARVYVAELPPNKDFSGYFLSGADYILCRPDETMASPEERLQWVKWKWRQWAAGASDLTFTGCIRFLLSSPDEGEDCVSLDDVLLVLSGRYHA